MKFTAEIDAQIFKRVFAMAASIEDEPLMCALSTGLEFACIDSSHVVMFLASIPVRRLIKYDCIQHGTNRINASNLKCALKGVNLQRKSDGTLVISVEQNDKGRHVMHVRHVRQGKRCGNFTVSLDTLNPGMSDDDDSMLESFERTLAGKWTGGVERIPGAEFKAMMADLNRADDLFNVLISPGKVRFETPEKDEGSLSYSTEIESGDNVRIDGQGAGMYSTNMLAFFAEKAQLLPTIDILLGDQIPMEIEGEYRGTTIRVLLAPRVEDHDDEDYVDDFEDSKDDDKDGDEEPITGHEPAVAGTPEIPVPVANA